MNKEITYPGLYGSAPVDGFRRFRSLGSSLGTYGLDWRTPVLVLFCEKREQYVLRHWHGEETKFLYIRDKQQRYILRRVFSEGISESELTTHIRGIVGRSVESVVVRDEWLLPNRNRTREWPWEQRIDLRTQILAIVRVDVYKSIQARMKTAFL